MPSHKQEVTIFYNQTKTSAHLVFCDETDLDMELSLVLEIPIGQKFEGCGKNFFEALNQLRIKLDAENILLAIQGCRADFYWSNMSIQMSNGKIGYILELGKRATIKANTFDECININLLTTVQNQKSCFETWKNSL